MVARNARVIAVSTNKGGVLKTTTTTNLAGLLASEGNRVLMVDADNQGNVALSFGRNADDYENSLYDVLVHGQPAKEVIVNVYENIDILPSNDDMGFIEMDVLQEGDKSKYPNPFHLMKNALDGLRSEYDYIVIDTPPNIGLATGNALSFADEVLIPYQPETYSYRSLIKMFQAVEQFRKNQNSNLKILGVLGTMVDSRTSLHSEMLSKLRQTCLELDIKCFDSVIPRSVRFASSVAYEGLPATLVEAKQPLVYAYQELLNEIKERHAEWVETNAVNQGK